MQVFNFREAENKDYVESLIRWHNENSPYVTIDTETTGLNPHVDTLTAIIITDRSPNSAVLFSPTFVDCLKQLKRPVVAHNFKFDFNMLYRAGVDLRACGGLQHDTMLLHHLLDENASHALDAIVQERYGDNYKAVFWSTFKAFDEAPKDRQLEYACKDVIYTDLLYRDLSAELRDSEIPDSLKDHVRRLALSLYDTELRGLKVDIDYLTAIGAELKPKIAEFQRKMHDSVAGYCKSVELDLYAEALAERKTEAGKARVSKPVFNFDSNKQLCGLLYDKLKLPVKLNKNRNRTVDDAALEENASKHPLVPLIQEYRTYQKAYTAFIEGTFERMHEGRIYPSFNINGTVTGRISSSNPNMQQLPAKGEWAKIRGLYVPDPGNKLVTCDYSQLEVVVAAHFSQDKNLLKIIHEGASKHDITAEGLGIPRHIAKTLNFAMQYQCSPRKVAFIVGCSPGEAERIHSRYWELYSGEKAVIDECKRKVDRGEPIINPFGRRRRFPSRFESRWEREAAYRQAYSSLIQGTGSDICHTAFYTADNLLQVKMIGRALFEIHDEIVIEVDENACEIAQDVLKSTMVGVGNSIALTVPLTVDCSEPLERWVK